jgi:putative nucleotidyltransferase with HDIG domain
MARSIKTADQSQSIGISMSEILSALSFALDLTEGAVPGHALRSCLIGMRIGARAGLSSTQMQSLYYALLLKDVGCSSNSARMCQIIGGDDRAIKAGVKLEDWTKPHKPKASTFKLLWEQVLPDASPLERMVRIAKIGMSQHANNREMITLRCDRGAFILRKLGMSEDAAEAVRYLDEHWEGSGYPERRRKDHIPLLARICSVAQSIDVFSTEQGAEAAIAVLNERSGRWFDPELVQIAVALHNEGSLWQDCARGDDPERTRAAVKDLAPDSIDLAADQIDNVCLAFAEVIDAKSPFTYRHSMDVATAAAGIAETLGLPSEACVRIRRAGLLHDLGKLSVPNSILDKPTQLSAAEWTVVKGHPGLSRSILERVSAFRQLSVIAGNHHERLDGSGYPDKKSAGLLSLESRILSVADVFGALTEERPYRASLDLEQVASIMAKDVPRRLDPACYEALLIFASRNEHRPVQSTMLPELPPEACVLSA